MTTAARPLDVLPPTTSPSTEPLVLTQDDIRRLLPMYKPEAVFMREAVLRDGKLEAVFDTFDHPFSAEAPRHVTREHAVVFITQAAYVLTSLMATRTGQLPLTLSRFWELALAEQVVFTRMHLDFHRLIRNRHGINLELWCERHRVLWQKIHGRLRFAFPEGCSGYCDAVIALDASLNCR